MIFKFLGRNLNYRCGCRARSGLTRNKYEADSDQDNFETGVATYEDAVSNDRSKKNETGDNQ